MKKIFSIILLSLPSLLYSQGDLDLAVYNYIFVDSLGNNYSEKEYAEQGAVGNYNKLKVRTNDDLTTFKFHLRKDCDTRTFFKRKETYTYKVLEQGTDNDVIYWVLLRNDSVKLVFDYHTQIDSYSLTIPADQVGDELYVYLFTKTK